MEEWPPPRPHYPVVLVIVKARLWLCVALGQSILRGPITHTTNVSTRHDIIVFVIRHFHH